MLQISVCGDSDDDSSRGVLETSGQWLGRSRGKFYEIRSFEFFYHSILFLALSTLATGLRRMPQNLKFHGSSSVIYPLHRVKALIFLYCFFEQRNYKNSFLL
ncbi:unnamed protein product [Lactuca virosa]|uniref:Uncharacterized protein n=1 Tax=Lactuca virosa TaxID=75947 RepID=A0AAU9MD18_9ASTR|nr:unnamed protein product [Lactuca virosa]